MNTQLQRSLQPRRFVMHLCLLVFPMFLSLWPAIAGAQSEALTAAYNKSLELQEQGRYQEAIPFAEKAVALAEEEFGPQDPNVAVTLVNLAGLYHFQGRYSEAEPLYKRALAIREKTLGLDHPDVAISLDILATLYRQQRRFAEAEPLFKRALAIQEKTLGPEHPDVAISLYNLAVLYLDQGAQYTEAESLLKRALAIQEKTLGLDHPNVAKSLNTLALIFTEQGRYAEAEPLYKRALAIQEKALGSEHPQVATSLNNLAELYHAQGRYSEAEPMLKRALAIRQKALGSEHPQVATSLNNLAELYRDQGRYSEAEPLYKRALVIFEKTLGKEHPDVAQCIYNLATLYYEQGRYVETEQLLKRALVIREKALGPEHPLVATTLNNLAGLYDKQGRYSEAEPLYKRALAIQEKTLGLEHPNVAISLNRLGKFYYKQRRFAEAESLFKRALAIREKAFGPVHSEVAESLYNLGVLYHDQGARYTEAESLFERALAIQEKTLGLEHPDLTSTLNNLAMVFTEQGRYTEAEPLYQRALAIAEKTLGPEHPDVATALDNLACLYHDQHRYSEAEPLYQRALAIRQKTLGAEHPSVARSLNNLAELYRAQGRYSESEPLLKRALVVSEKTLGQEHPLVATCLNNLAELYHAQGRYSEAEPLYQRALAIQEKALGPEHPDVAASLNNLALLYGDQGRYSEALDFSRRACSVHRKRSMQAASERSIGSMKEQTSVRVIFLNYISIANNLIKEAPKQRENLTAESFEIAQLAHASEAAQAVSRMAARFGAGDDKLAQLVRTQEDALDRWRQIDAQLVKAVSEPPEKRNAELEQRLRAEMAELDQKLQNLDAQLAHEFPKYVELANPRPTPVKEIQQLLQPQEALVMFVVGNDKSCLWVIRKDKVAMKLIALGEKELQDFVGDLRKGLDQSDVLSIKELKPFDVERSHKLYTKLFAPAEPLLEGARHVMIVPDGALQSLPFNVLVTEDPEGITDYRAVSWLAKKYALTTLPSAGSLRALRRFAKTSSADEPFVGFGDPLLEGSPGSTRGIDSAALFTRGATADVDQLRHLPRLPGTADELLAVATALKADKKHVYLREQATELRARREDLSRFRVVAFSTHGLMAGEFKLGEPGLVLTPPEEPTPANDGLLAASEVAQLNLNADWVILSACNTAAPEGAAPADESGGAEGLSGLAKAFFYAGSRALLVSHWQVSSDATIELITRMFAERERDPKLGRAEALQRSMLALMNSKDKPYYAHPFFWAPFVVVGEGL